MKIIGTDFDGTLNYKGFDDAKLNAIKKWRAAGNVFAIISGRGLSGLIDLPKTHGFECDYFMACSGSLIAKADGTIISSVECNADILPEILEFLFENGCIGAGIQTDFPCVVYKDYEKHKNNSHCYSLENLPEIKYFNQINSAWPDVETSIKGFHAIKEKLGHLVNPLYNGCAIDIVRPDMNKAKGMHILKDLLGVKFEDVIVVGDNGNDIDMLKEFRSYGMENGGKSIVEAATFSTQSVTDVILKEL